MPGWESLGKLLILMGLVIVALGVLLLVAGRLPLFGRLPGDIFLQRGNFSCWIPLGSMIALSIMLSLLLSFLAWITRR